MKKILYSLMAIAGLMTTSCISFDDPVTENYGVGPTATITVTETTDSTFTFTVNPGENALYYSILVDQSADTAAVDAETLLKGSYASVYNVVKNTKDAATFTYNMRKANGAPLCMPGKTYQIYAVAASDKGVLGEVAVATVSTTDQLAPRPTQYEYDPAEKTMYVLFSEAIARGEGAVKAVSYKYYDLVNGKFAGEEVEEVEVVVDGDVIAITANTNPGAYVAFSWEAGAFVDAAGHACTALNSGFSMQQGDFVGLVGQNDTEAFEVTELNVVEPAIGGTIGDWEAFYGTLMFDMNVFANTKAAADAVTLTYKNAKSETTVKLTYGEHWDTSANTFIFVLPKEPEFGDKVSIKIAEGAFTDAYGNPNAEVEFADAWLRSYGFTRDLVVGNYIFAHQSGFDGKVYTATSSIAADAKENVVAIAGFADYTDDGVADCTIKGVFNGDYGTITVPCGQIIGEDVVVMDDNVTTAEVWVVLEEYDGAEQIVFQVDEEGTIVNQGNMWTYSVYEKTSQSFLGYFAAGPVTMGMKDSGSSTQALPKAANGRTLNVKKLTPKK